MDATAILNKILADASEAASTILSEAGQKTDALRAESEKRVTAAKEQILAKAKGDAVDARARMRRVAEMDERKLLLADKRNMMERAFGKALDMLNHMPAQQARSFLVDTVASLADGDEVIIPGDVNDGWLDQDFATDCNAALSKRGKAGLLKLSREKREGLCGLVLTKQNTEINCSFEALLNSQRLEMEADVAAVLFPA